MKAKPALVPLLALAQPKEVGFKIPTVSKEPKVNKGLKSLKHYSYNFNDFTTNESTIVECTCVVIE